MVVLKVDFSGVEHDLNSFSVKSMPPIDFGESQLGH